MMAKKKLMSAREASRRVKRAGERWNEMLGACIAARSLLTAEYGAILNTACPKGVAGEPIIPRIHPSFRALAARYRRVIKKIDGALS